MARSYGGWVAGVVRPCGLQVAGMARSYGGWVVGMGCSCGVWVAGMARSYRVCWW
jgi:hypothetical protein